MVTNANVNVEEIKQSVKDWQTTVNNTITEAERLIQEKEDNPGCFKGLRPNCITRYKHSKKAFKLKQDIVLKQEEKFDSVSYPTIPLEKNFDKLRGDVSKLKNARLKVQCKITEAKNNVEEITEDVTETPDTKKIQTVIANKLCLKFEDAKWKMGVKEQIVGIPSLADRGRNKILMTTRNVDVLEKMGSTKNLGMGILNEEEAWRLFQKMAATDNLCHTLSLPCTTTAPPNYCHLLHFIHTRAIAIASITHPSPLHPHHSPPFRPPPQQPQKIRGRPLSHPLATSATPQHAKCRTLPLHTHTRHHHHHHHHHNKTRSPIKLASQDQQQPPPRFKTTSLAQN
ncbi:hypothetical protein Patl1_24439 [Pistacia atlantica]|uniref:Uncharacterized protein n=1 Tax=Pistacia atlantica TaxID=434234 RepID=A0ACC0ZUJ9_9ROSI|nr:hypothetical protein Patl1_24439 [Pistacia atlantica]